MLTETVIKDFKKTVEGYSSSSTDKEVKDVFSKIERIANQAPAIYDSENIGNYLAKRNEVLNTLVEDYFSLSMSKEFPLISEELFGLKRKLTLEGKGNNYSVIHDETTKEDPKNKSYTGSGEKVSRKNLIVPLFVYTPLFNKEHKAELGSFSRTVRKSNWEYGSQTVRQSVKLSAKLPGIIGPNLREAARNAMSHYYSILSEMFTSPIASEILYKNSTEPEIGAIWIPTAESIIVQSKEKVIEQRNLDPAMIITARGKKYLVDTWQVDYEEPFESYLREFTTGNLKGKIK
ncbi:Uncharacterised protein [uncultured archaeon]|nr:Uncharacterised protein [uncultured archaeon]